MAVVEARNLRKTYRKTLALDGVDLSIGEGRIVGLLGPNGAGKSTALQAILGLVSHEGELRVLDRDPWSQRGELVHEVCFIADVAVLPRWMRVGQAVDYMAGVHPRFDRARAEGFLARSTIRKDSRIRELSKGMVTQLHLALVMAVDARLLVLDEPTLGLDLLYRKSFFDALLSDYVDHDRTIILSTHDVHEIQHVLTDVIFLDRGRVALSATMEEVEARFVEVLTTDDRLAAARALKPVSERRMFGRHSLLFDGVDRERLAPLGEPRTPGLADLFVALLGGGAPREAAA
ncbi:ABC transporter ATP-binding protein [Brevundimonas sp.]|uniref:ABC transporter ATP-binding protein n=1 Tax=Brevundimonas sp. TaxID=1871086 RepID=UPI002737F771|nr:ABC transporter ATP-binding protein [Brevundimonas sp.]MDP3803581.1 ABC transporter ATP-binding protein [Brevundimonas sp.]